MKRMRDAAEGGQLMAHASRGQLDFGGNARSPSLMACVPTPLHVCPTAASSKRQLPNGQKFDFDGWSGFRKQIIVKGLAHEWSNPKKVSLTPQVWCMGLHGQWLHGLA